MEKEITNIIESYCEGINWLEFNKEDLPKMVEEILNCCKQIYIP